jgi:hypothetical protein
MPEKQRIHSESENILCAADCMAEREGFEPPIPFRVWPLSRRLVSTTHAPLRAVKIVVADYFIRCDPTVLRSANLFAVGASPPQYV